MQRNVFRLTMLIVGLCSSVSVVQTLKPRPLVGSQQQSNDAPASQKVSGSLDAAPTTMPMSVTAGTPIKVALDSEVRVREVGEAIRRKTTEPVYAWPTCQSRVCEARNGM
jgi:hypothetical protein